MFGGQLNFVGYAEGGIFPTYNVATYTMGAGSPAYAVGGASLAYAVGGASPAYSVGAASPAYSVGAASPAYSVGAASPAYAVGDSPATAFDRANAGGLDGGYKGAVGAVRVENLEFEREDVNQVNLKIF